MGLLVLLALFAFGAGASSSRGLPFGAYRGLYWRVVQAGDEYRLQLWWNDAGQCQWTTWLSSTARPTMVEALTMSSQVIDLEWSQNPGGAMVSGSCPPHP